MNEQKPAPYRKIPLGKILLGIAGLIVGLIIVLMLLGPIVGNVFYTINHSLGYVDGEESYRVARVNNAPAIKLASLDVPPLPAERLIIRTGYLSLTVEDTLAAQQEIEKIVTELAGEGAFLVSSNASASNEGGSPTIETVIRVPSARFDDVMDRLSKLAVKVNIRNEAAQDVTAEYVDVSAREQALETARDRLLEIMKNAATTEELLLAEQQLTQREAEIESLKGRMQYLSESARLSSITIELSPYLLSQPIENKWRPAETARRAYDTLLASLRGFGNFLIIFVIDVLPWLALIGLIWWGVAAIVRKRRDRKQAGAAKE